jgi:hypothetical protein
LKTAEDNKMVISGCAALAAVAGAVILEPRGAVGLSDMIVLAPSDTAVATVCYYNHIAGASQYGVHQLELDGVPVIVHVDWTDGTEERITIEAPIGFYIWPADDAVTDLPDGEAVTVQILGGLG